MKFSIVIPTYSRENDLIECISSIISQTLFPSEIVIVDDDDLGRDFLEMVREKIETKNINFVYYKKDHAQESIGSSASRNKGIDLAKEKIVFIFDDDVILDSNFLEEIMKLWEKNINDSFLLGISGIAKNYRKKNFFENIYNKFFKLTSAFSWDITDVAFQVWDTSIASPQKGYYMSGYCCSYRKDSLNYVGNFNEIGKGRTANEDIDFCLRAKNKDYHFIINPHAKVFHKRSKIARENFFVTGFKESYNRKIIFQNNCTKSFRNYVWFFWSNLGWILRQLLTGKFRMAAGMIVGILTLIKE